MAKCSSKNIGLAFSPEISSATTTKLRDARCDSKTTTPPPATKLQRTAIDETHSIIRPPLTAYNASSTNDKSCDARAGIKGGVTRASGPRKGCASESNARDSNEEMSNQDLAVRLESNLWQEFLTAHDGLLLICKRRQIGMHSCHPEHSLDAKDKAARSTPLVR